MTQRRRLSRSRMFRILFWVSALFTATLVSAAIHISPAALHGIVDARTLELGSMQAHGAVVELHQRSGRERCQSQASVQHRVGDAAHQVVVSGCGAAPGGTLHVGDQARVTYAVSEPGVSEATAAGASSYRPGWVNLLAVCGFAAACTLGLPALFRRGWRSPRDAA